MPTTPPSPASEPRSADSDQPSPRANILDRDPGILWLRLSGWLFLLLALSTAVVMGLGSRLPAAHTQTVIIDLPAPAARVWQLLTDLPHQTSWRSDLDNLQPLADQNSLPCWTELHGHLAIPLCVTENTPPTHRTVNISDPRLPLQGSWTFTLQPLSATSTRLTVTETQQIPTLMWRFAIHYLHGNRTTLDRLAADLRTAAARS